jgi:hypothetical protein
MGPADLTAQLRVLGYEVTEVDGDRVSFTYEIEVGSRAGEEVTLGFVLPGDFPASPPSGPHVSPRLLPLRSDGEHPTGRIHESPQFGEAFEYWSRPFPTGEWAKSKRNAATYMAFIRGLFASL